MFMYVDLLITAWTFSHSRDTTYVFLFYLGWLPTISSLGDGCITAGYRYVNFSWVVVYLVVFLLVLIQNTIFFFYFRSTSIQMAPSFSTTSCGKLMHVFYTDIGFLFFVLDYSPSTIIKQNKIKPLDLKGGSGVQGGFGLRRGDLWY